MSRFVICPVEINPIGSKGVTRTAFLVQDIDLPVKPRYNQRVEIIDVLDGTKYNLGSSLTHVVPNYMKNKFLGTEHEATIRANFAALRLRYPKCDSQSSFNNPEV